MIAEDLGAVGEGGSIGEVSPCIPRIGAFEYANTAWLKSEDPDTLI